MFMFILLISLVSAYDTSIFNEFSADVDIYDMGRMGRGKNAGSWHRSLKNKQEVFYYLAMQPWRHLVWTDCTGTECYKYYINEDASNIPTNGKKLSIEKDNDYCRKEYAHPMATFDIDWTRVDSNTRLETVDINGQTCYEYPAQLPLAKIYLRQQYQKEKDVGTVTVCRYDFVGGKSITFRSFNEFSSVFISNDATNGYLGNKTKCNIDPSPNNVDTDLAIVLGISDKNIVQTVNSALTPLASLKTVKQVRVFYLSGESIKKETVALDNLASLKTKQITTGSVDAVINTAKNEMVKRVNSGAIERATMVVLMDRALATTFDAETAFDRNNITVHTVIYNPKNDLQMQTKARSLLSVGEHYHEFTRSLDISSTMTELFNGIRTNLTERCDRKACNGFCDGRDRCTCPMCCENTCFFTYCDVNKASCEPWPPAAPKAKITCQNDCVGEQKCIDLEGCVYTKYNKGCEPPAKCMKPVCIGGECDFEDACEKDLTPSYDNKCWSYKCDEATGLCVRDKSGNTCPTLPDKCHEYSCDDKLKCSVSEKKCVKTSPYIEMDCYVAKCNKKSGVCENRLECESDDTFVGCGATAGQQFCKCDSSNGFKCSCRSDADNFCKDGEICDASDPNHQYCKVSKCDTDIYQKNCIIHSCDEETGEKLETPVNCSGNVIFQYKSNEAKEKCAAFYSYYCSNDECLGGPIEGYYDTNQVGCKKCVIRQKKEKVENKNTYEISYEGECTLQPKCPDGTTLDELYAQHFEDGNFSHCYEYYGEDKNTLLGRCVYNNITDQKIIDEMCAPCFTPVECYNVPGIVTYSFNVEKGRCEREIHDNHKAGDCSVCNANKDGYESTCVNDFDKVLTAQFKTKSQAFTYTIPRVCMADQCIPDPDFDCNNQSFVAKLKEMHQACGGEITVGYHYSDQFKRGRFNNHVAQNQLFMNEAVEEAYCYYEYTAPIDFNKPQCHTCVIDDNGDEKDVDECAKFKKENELPEDIDVYCIEETRACKFDYGDCHPMECYNEVIDKGTNKCKRVGKHACNATWENIEKIYANYTRSNPYEKEINITATGVCDYSTNTSCIFNIDDSPCKQALRDYQNGEVDFGCRKPTGEYDPNTYRCTYVDITIPSEDIRKYRDESDVVLRDLCYNYTCMERFNENGTLVHTWNLTQESIDELSKKPESKCETVTCDASTGRAVTKPIVCAVSDSFKQITEAQAECFTCQCSLLTGEMVLSMLPDTDEVTYELDACGNCIVRDRKTGEQVNNSPECVLDAPVNLTGAIAGATVAASVVFGLIGAMVVVSIGALQTYQLVSSAMKNVIATTLENPEFVAADNEATNALAAD